MVKTFFFLKIIFTVSENFKCHPLPKEHLLRRCPSALTRCVSTHWPTLCLWRPFDDGLVNLDAFVSWPMAIQKSKASGRWRFWRDASLDVRNKLLRLFFYECVHKMWVLDDTIFSCILIIIYKSMLFIEAMSNGKGIRNLDFLLLRKDGIILITILYKLICL